jgi:uncharacterized membrane protein YphA (DoxX/SURF4 family)
MKIVTLIARILLGLEFLIFGLNGFLQFLHMPPPTGLAAQYFGVLFMSHYYIVIFLLQALGGVLLLLNRFVPLALTILGPVLVNILIFHVTMNPEGLPMALVTFGLWLIVFLPVRRVFAPLLSARVSA